MAKRAKRKTPKKKAKMAKKRKPAKRAAKKAKRPKKSSAKREPSKKARSSSAGKVTASPSGRGGGRRPPNQPTPLRRPEPRELAQAAPDARFDDPRRPQSTAREHPGGSALPIERNALYKNTDEPL